MRSLAIIHPGPAWSDGRPVFDQDPTVLREHLGHLRRLFALGAMLLRGPALDGRSGMARAATPTIDIDSGSHDGAQEPAIELAGEPDQEPVLA